MRSAASLLADSFEPNAHYLASVVVRIVTPQNPTLASRSVVLPGFRQRRWSIATLSSNDAGITRVRCTRALDYSAHSVAVDAGGFAVRATPRAADWLTASVIGINSGHPP